MDHSTVIITQVWLSGLAFALIHSLFASQVVKHWCYQKGLIEPRYRLFYTLLAMLLTGLWIFYVRQLQDAPLYAFKGIARYLLRGLQLVGAGIALASFLPIDGAAFLGLKRSRETQDPFIVKGIYLYLRHPMYSGTMLFLLADPTQTQVGLQFTLVICAYFLIGSRLEEQRMIHQHPEYEQYRQHTPGFIPLPQPHKPPNP